MRKLLHIFTLSLVIAWTLSSCESKEDKAAKIEAIKQAKRDSVSAIFTHNSERLIKETNAIDKWDTLKYTYEIQDLCNQPRPISVYGYIKDIAYRNDGVLAVSVVVYSSAYEKSFSATVIVTANDTDFVKLLNDEKTFDELVTFIIKPKRVGVYSPQFNAVAEKNEDESEDNAASINIDTRAILVHVEGNLIRYCFKMPINED